MEWDCVLADIIWWLIVAAADGYILASLREYCGNRVGTPGAGFEVMAFSASLARHGVGGGTSRRRGDMNNRWGQIEAA